MSHQTAEACAARRSATAPVPSRIELLAPCAAATDAARSALEFVDESAEDEPAVRLVSVSVSVSVEVSVLVVSLPPFLVRAAVRAALRVCASAETWAPMPLVVEVFCACAMVLTWLPKVVFVEPLVPVLCASAAPPETSAIAAVAAKSLRILIPLKKIPPEGAALG